MFNSQQFAGGGQQGFASTTQQNEFQFFMQTGGMLPSNPVQTQSQIGMPIVPMLGHNSMNHSSLSSEQFFGWNEMNNAFQTLYS